MRERSGLITSAELVDIIDQPDLRLFDCTTYLEPAAEGSKVPYTVVPGRHTYEAGHIPNADFLDLQGEFSDQGTAASLHDAWTWRSSRPRSAVTGIGRKPGGTLQHRHPELGDAILADAEIAGV